ncbi:universal stress protein [Saccharopolyspora sp. MS10]|uniref:universal stress protein n=1 Tax=Saccharopolyspora sp. MS10 TaxID=3385973 RepID=UPI0039A14879
MFLPARTVLAAVDGSEPASRAAGWAAAEAASLRASLQLVRFYEAESRRSQAEESVRAIAGDCRIADPELHVRARAIRGDPARELVARSREASLLVLGSRGHGAVHDVLLGSVSAAAASGAGCPAVVVRGTGSAGPGPVVVGLDLSPESRPALHFAFDSADRRDRELLVVQALPEAYFLPSVLGDPQRRSIQEEAESRIGAQLTVWQEHYPEVRVRRIATDQHPVEALCEQAEGARLLVVGHRSQRGPRLGSVALGALHRAPCPVAVVGDHVGPSW